MDFVLRLTVDDVPRNVAALLERNGDLAFATFACFLCGKFHDEPVLVMIPLDERRNVRSATRDWEFDGRIQAFDWNRVIIQKYAEME